MNIIKKLDTIIEQSESNILNNDKFKVIEASAGLSRIISHVQSGISFIIITAFRGEYSKNKNIIRNKQLLSDIKENNLGAIQLEGYWTENAGTPDELKVVEVSYFIPNKTWSGESLDNEQFKQLGIELRDKYNQESFLYGDGKDIYVVSKDEEFSIGNAVHVTYKEFEEIYSKIKNKNFIFSCVYAPIVSNYASAVYFKSKGYYLFDMK